jgi:DNA-binding CsgD family transcriptional regulator
MEHRGRKSKIENIGEKVYKLAIAGYSYQEIADTLGLKSKQLARYHYLTFSKRKVK